MHSSNLLNNYAENRKFEIFLVDIEERKKENFEFSSAVSSTFLFEGTLNGEVPNFSMCNLCPLISHKPHISIFDSLSVLI